MLRKTTILGLAALALLAGGQTSRAAYTLSTTESNFTTTSGVFGLTTLAPGTVISGPGFSATATYGGFSFLDGAGSTFYVLNDSETGTGLVSTNVQVYVNAAAGDSVNFSFLTTIAVNGTAAFTETLGANFFSGTGFLLIGTSVVGSATSVSGSYSQNGLTVTNLSSSTVSGNANSNANPAVGATFLGVQTIPEPASVAMLGLGLVGVGGFAARRRMAK